MSRNMRERFRRCFLQWVEQQESDLDELLKAIPSPPSSSSNNDDVVDNEAQMRALVEKGMRRFEEYSEKRMALAKEYAPTFYCPVWCSSFENSFLWMGRCRPTMAIRLVYALSGSDAEARVDEIVRDGGRGSGGAGRRMLVLSAKQLNHVSELHCRTLRDEESLTRKMAALQEDVADDPLLSFVKHVQMAKRSGSRRIEEMYVNWARSSGEGTGSSSRSDDHRDINQVEGVMDRYAETLAKLLQEADLLRIKTVRELVMDILTPVQAAELLAAGKQLHLSLHEWSKKREEQQNEGSSSST